MRTKTWALFIEFFFLLLHSETNKNEVLTKLMNLYPTTYTHTKPLFDYFCVLNSSVFFRRSRYESISDNNNKSNSMTRFFCRIP